MTAKDAADQRKIVIEDYGLTNGCGSKCEVCVPRDGQKCFDEDVCVNMTETGSDTLRFTCPLDCDDFCVNNM